MDLSQFFLTKSQATDFATRISNIIDVMYTTDFNLEKALSTQFSMIKKDLFLKLMREENVDTGSISSVREFLKKVQENLTSLPVVDLTIAFDPTEEMVKNISTWCVANLGKQLLFNIQIDQSLIAGTKITYNGKFKDYSIAPIFHAFLSHFLESRSQPQQDTSDQTYQSTEHIELGR